MGAGNRYGQALDWAVRGSACAQGKLGLACMIRHNGASQKGKGLHWQFKELKEQLRWHYRRYGRQGGVLLMENNFSGYIPDKE